MTMIRMMRERWRRADPVLRHREVAE